MISGSTILFIFLLVQLHVPVIQGVAVRISDEDASSLEYTASKADDENPLEAYSQEIGQESAFEDQDSPLENMVNEPRTITDDPSSDEVQTCSISTPGSASQECTEERQDELEKKRAFYKLRKLNKNPGPGEFQIPVLDQPPNKILRLAMSDPFSAHHFNMLFITFGMTLKDKIVPAALGKFARRDLTSYEDYFEVADFFKKALKLDKSESKYFRVPSVAYPYYTDLVKDKKFLKDKYFVQQRLAGINPMSIQRVTSEGDIGVTWTKLSSKLNPMLQWEDKIMKITGKDLATSVKENLVYALEFPMLDGMEDVPDILDGKTKPPGTKMLGHTNPIAIFALKLNKKGKYRMKPVAIQIDSKKDADVYTPKDGFNWDLAKLLVQGADFLFSQIHEHLLRTHFRMETVCVSLYRHLSGLHPLHELLKYHCRGLFPLNANGTIVLLSPGKYAHALFPVGHLGAFKLLQKGYAEMVWDDFGIDNVKRRGMDDKEKVPYFPYRDDGEVLDKAFRKFGKTFVNLYYKNDQAIRQDEEIQNFINELSVDGVRPPDNGKGHIKGLPGSFETREQLGKFIAQTLWIQVQHAVISFMPGILGTMAPFFPTKLYDDKRAKEKNDIVYMLPGALAACMQAGLTHTVGALQYDVMFDYSDEIRDPMLKDLVADMYDKFMQKIKSKLDKRNKKRASYGQLTNPFMVPGWMPNSIST